MQAIELIIALLVVVVVFILVLIVRRRVLLRGAGAVDMALRRRVGKTGGGWALGVGRFSGDQLEWFRAFSFAPRPSRQLARATLIVERQRKPEGAESWAVQPHAVVLECLSDSAPVQVAMTVDAMPGFLSWLESAAPGHPGPPPRRSGRRPRR